MTPELLDDYIHGNKYAEVAGVEINQHASGEMVERGTELLFEKEPQLVFCKTDFLGNLFSNTQDVKTSHILISHNSDFPITADMFDNRPKWVDKWYALNVACARPQLLPIPSGMERPEGGGYSSDVFVLRDRWLKPHNHQNILYMNHNVNNNERERGPMTRRLSNENWVTWRPHGTSFHDYIKNCYEHMFVASPIGNGIDCHRTWEALYMGTFPIVKRSILSDYFSALGVPQIIVADWEIVTEELLLICHNELNAERKNWNLNPLTMSFWIHDFLNDLEILGASRGSLDRVRSFKRLERLI